MNKDLSIKHKLLDQAEKLNRALEDHYIALALVLVDIERNEAYREAGYANLSDYGFHELGRQKSTVSRLLSVGTWLTTNGCVDATEGATYQKLYEAVKAFPNKEPAYILAAAKTNTLAEIRQNRRDDDPCEKHEWITICSKCHMRKE